MEPRQLLSAVQATISSTSTAPAAIGAVPGVTAGASTIGPVGSGGTVQTTGIGSIQFIQSALPVTGLLDNLDSAPTTVSATTGPISVASGLLSLPITPLLPLTVSSNETPLNNGTPILGTVWITPVPDTLGVFHPNITSSSTAASTLLQTPNPQGGPPPFTHFGQGIGGNNGTSVGEQSVAVGPQGPALMDQVEPTQAPPAAEQQPAGQPAQQQSAPAQQNAPAPGQQGVEPAQPPAAAGQQGGTSGQQGSQSPAQGAPAPRQPGPGAAPGEGGGATGGSGGATSGSRSSGSGPSAFLTPPDPGLARVQLAASLELIDAALPSVSSQPGESADDAKSATGLSSLFGAAVVVAGGYQFALRKPDRLKGGWKLEPRDARREPGRRFGSPSHN